MREHTTSLNKGQKQNGSQQGREGTEDIPTEQPGLIRRALCEPAKSVPGCTGELSDVKKASGKLGSKPSGVDSYSFMDELSESQQLQEQLRAIVHELKETVELLEQNLQDAHRATRSQREAKAASARKMNSASEYPTNVPASALPRRVRRSNR